jgi:crotonobetainyl-CoA:carnitine CoA-transferase CaiB-like acyl-CoA transferase
MEALHPVGIPVGPVNTVSEALAAPQTVAREMVVETDHPAIGPVSMLGVPFKMFGTSPSIRRPPPLLGQHSREVLIDEIGLDQPTIDGLVSAGVTTINTLEDR